jgi:hypothetical protein
MLDPVSGEVYFNDAPAERAIVVLHPADPKAPKPSGTAGAVLRPRWSRSS